MSCSQHLHVYHRMLWMKIKTIRRKEDWIDEACFVRVCDKIKRQVDFLSLVFKCLERSCFRCCFSCWKMLGFAIENFDTRSQWTRTVPWIDHPRVFTFVDIISKRLHCFLMRIPLMRQQRPIPGSSTSKS